jgi:soluble lytic murein transglycosylase
LASPRADRQRRGRPSRRRIVVRRFVALAVLLGILVGVGGTTWSAQPVWLERARYPLRFEALINAHARNYELDPALLAAVIYTESRFRPDARSSAGAVGLMQLLPTTAQGIATRTGGKGYVESDLLDPEINVRYGAWYLRSLVRRFGDVGTALAAYHAGPTQVETWRADGEGIAFPKTRAYVDGVLHMQEVYARAYAEELR